MKITQQFAGHFARDWINAWNDGDIEAIMHHYAEDIRFSSPFILKAQVNNKGTIYGKAELRQYFEKALTQNPDLHFDLKHIMVGIKSIMLIYIRKHSLLASEVMILDGAGLVIEGLSHYPLKKYLAEL